MRPATRIRYGTRRDQFAELRLPEAAGEAEPVPVAVLIHGGFWRARYGLGLERALAADLARRGWAAYNLEYRRLGLRSRGGYPATFDDVAAGIDALAGADAPLDLERVVAIGHSAGGQLALWAASRASQPAGAPGARPRIGLAGAVAQAGVVDLREAARLGLSGGVTVRLLGGSPAEQPERYDLASPVERLPLGVPHLLVHGDADDTVPVELARSYAGRARRAGDRCELAELRGCGHFEHLDPDSAAWQEVVGWLERVWPSGASG